MLASGQAFANIVAYYFCGKAIGLLRFVPLQGRQKLSTEAKVWHHPLWAKGDNDLLPLKKSACRPCRSSPGERRRRSINTPLPLVSRTTAAAPSFWTELFYLSFSVANPTSARITEMIQKRTTTVDSCQPFCSKW